MIDLVKRLRDSVFEVAEVVSMDKLKKLNSSAIEAADRIEELERELAAEREHSATAWSENAKQIDMQMAATMRANGAELELAAEKALADRLWTELWAGRSWAFEDVAKAYRKARGM